MTPPTSGGRRSKKELKLVKTYSENGITAKAAATLPIDEEDGKVGKAEGF